MKKEAKRQVIFLFFFSLGKDLNPCCLTHNWPGKSDLQLYKKQNKNEPKKPMAGTQNCRQS